MPAATRSVSGQESSKDLDVRHVRRTERVALVELELLHCREATNRSSTDGTVGDRPSRGLEAFPVEPVLPPAVLSVVEGGVDVRCVGPWSRP